MAARHIGIPSGLTEQPGYRFTKNRTGMVTVVVNYTCPASALHSLIPPLGAPHERFSYAGLDEITGVQEEGDTAIITCVFKGADPAEATRPPTYKLLAQTREEPLGTHKDFKDQNWYAVKLWQKGETDNPDKYAEYKYQMEEDGPWYTLTDTELKYAKKILSGKTTFMNRALVWREEKTGTAGHSSISSVGKIAAPAGGAPSNGTGNWLLSSMESEQQGKAHKLSREWMASGPEGWDPDIYS